ATSVELHGDTPVRTVKPCWALYVRVCFAAAACADAPCCHSGASSAPATAIQTILRMSFSCLYVNSAVTAPLVTMDWFVGVIASNSVTHNRPPPEMWNGCAVFPQKPRRGCPRSHTYAMTRVPDWSLTAKETVRANAGTEKNRVGGGPAAAFTA